MIKSHMIRAVVYTCVIGAACTHRALSLRTETVSPVRATITQPAVVPSASATPRRFTQGEVLYLNYCADCHGWEGRGDGPLASILVTKPHNLRQRPELFTYSDAELVERILSGKALRVPLDPGMLPYPESEVTALLTYLQQLPTLAWAEINRGQNVYNSLCVACHGLYGRGDGLGMRALSVRPRDLSTPAYQKQIRDEELQRIIVGGQGAMPGAKDVLTPPEVQAVIAFLRILSPGYELYNRFCVYCHGSQGLSSASDDESPEASDVAQAVPTFDETYFRTHTPEQVRLGIQHMRKQSRPTMPHFSGELSADEVSDIVIYLRTLPPES